LVKKNLKILCITKEKVEPYNELPADWKSPKD
jgi:hypothetical protein